MASPCCLEGWSSRVVQRSTTHCWPCWAAARGLLHAAYIANNIACMRMVGALSARAAAASRLLPTYGCIRQ